MKTYEKNQQNYKNHKNCEKNVNLHLLLVKEKFAAFSQPIWLNL